MSEFKANAKTEAATATWLLLTAFVPGWYLATGTVLPALWLSVTGMCLALRDKPANIVGGVALALYGAWMVL